MILATQRPAGVVDNRVKANTNLRIALRVQDDADSIDVIGSRDAAALARDRPGRAFVRRGAGDRLALQTALSTGVTSRDDDGGLVLRPFLAARPPTPIEAALGRERPGAAPRPGGPTDLEALVAAISAAAADVGQLDQRRPCPDPLPRHVALADLPTGSEPAAGVPFAFVDRPDDQRRDVRRWVPGRDGSLLVYGIAGSGASSTLATLALGAATTYSPDDAHLYVIDADAGLLGPLAALAHCGGVAGLGDLPRIGRIVHHLVGEVVRRRGLAVTAGSPERVIDAEPSITLFIDNVGALRQAIEADRDLDDVWPGLELVVRDGRAVGIGTVLAASHERAVTASMAAQIADRLLLRLGDRLAYSSFGIRSADVPTMTPGRALVPEGAVEVQIACPPADLEVAVAALSCGSVTRPPTRIGTLPDHVDVDLGRAVRTPTGVRLPVGLDVRTSTDRTISLEIGSSLLVLGPARSGRSSVLLALAQAIAAADPTIARFSVAPRPNLLGASDLTVQPCGPGAVADWVDAVASAGPAVVLVDDADRLDGPSFERLASIRRDDVAFVVAGTADGLRGVTHWTRPLLRTRSGILLKPTPTDGDLLRVQLPPRLSRMDVGRGLLVDDGEIVPVLVARPVATATDPPRC